MTVVAIHQPEYFPWLGLIDKVRRADVFVVLDHVQFDRSSLQHRAKIAGPSGVSWITIPYVHRFPQRIDELTFADPRWATKHWKSLQAAYGRAPGWRGVAPRLEAFFATPHARLADATTASMLLLLDAFGAMPGRVVRSSQLDVVGEKAELVHDICRKLGATRYLSGRSGATYLDREALAREGFELEVQSFSMPSYRGSRALPDSDAHGLSALDALLYAGAEAASLLAGGPRS